MLIIFVQYIGYWQICTKKFTSRFYSKFYRLTALPMGAVHGSDFTNTQAAAKHTGNPPGNIEAPVVLSTLETEPQTGEPNKSSPSAGLYKSQKGSQKRTDHHAVGC